MSAATTEIGGREFEQVVWVTGGSSQNLRTSRRHLAPLGAQDYQGSVPKITLCGRSFRTSQLVPPNDYWTDGDCQRCVKMAESL